jgi:hypothetical protein
MINLYKVIFFRQDGKALVGSIFEATTQKDGDNYLICDGRRLLIDDYNDLYLLIGNTYDPIEKKLFSFWKMRRILGLKFFEYERKNNEPDKYFYLPDLRNEAGLQFSGEPTKRAWEAGEVLDKCILHQEGDYVLDEDDWGIILEALQLMTEERR